MPGRAEGFGKQSAIPHSPYRFHIHGKRPSPNSIVGSATLLCVNTDSVILSRVTEKCRQACDGFAGKRIRARPRYPHHVVLPHEAFVSGMDEV